jgi:hypothetical protein
VYILNAVKLNSPKLLFYPYYLILMSLNVWSYVSTQYLFSSTHEHWVENMCIRTGSPVRYLHF